MNIIYECVDDAARVPAPMQGQSPLPKCGVHTSPDAFSCDDAEAPGVIWCVVKEGEVYAASISREDAEAYQKGLDDGDVCQYVSADQCEGLVGQRVYAVLDKATHYVTVHETQEGAERQIPAWAKDGDRYEMRPIIISE